MIIVLAALALLFFVISVVFTIKLWRIQKASSYRHPKGGTKLLCIATVVMLLVFLGSTVYACQIRIQNETEEDKISPLPDFTPARSVNDLYPDFKLSSVVGSNMLDLINILIGEQGISADAVDEGVNQLKTFLEQARTSKAYSIPEYLKLPEGELNYAFDDVNNVEDCLKEMRALDKQLRSLLENVHQDSYTREKIAEKSEHLTIRGKDAIFFGYPNGRNGKSIITAEETWLYAEYVFWGVVNEYIYGECTSSKLLDMYYRLSQTFDYLGGVADTDELRLAMDFIAVICSECAFEELEQQGLSQADSTYGKAIWGYYRDIIYRVALAVNSKKEDPTGFFEMMKTLDIKLETSALSEAQIESIQSTFGESKLYDDWKKKFETIEG